jgi:hypothetical protein
MKTRNAAYNAFGTIDCEIEHPALGWIPFTADPNDLEPLGKQVFDAAKGSASAYVPSPPPAPTAEDVRIERNRLLVESDWTQAADAPVDQAAWATYRQALRDIPQQAGFPASVDWPVKP